MRAYTALIVCCLLPFAAVADPVCQSPYPHVTMAVHNTPAEYDYTQSQDRFDPNTRGDMSGRTQITLTPTSAYSDGCLVLQRLDIAIRNTAKIRVSSAYPQGSCEFNVIKAHEARHLQVLHNFFSNLEPYKAEIIRQLVGKTAVLAKDRDVLTERLKEITSTLQEDLSTRQAELQYEYVDKPERVKAETSQCRNW